MALLNLHRVWKCPPKPLSHRNSRHSFTWNFQQDQQKTTAPHFRSHEDYFLQRLGARRQVPLFIYRSQNLREQISGEGQCTPSLKVIQASPGTSLLCRLLFIISTSSISPLWLWNVIEVGHLGRVREEICGTCFCKDAVVLCRYLSDGQPVLRGRAGLHSGFWPEIQWIWILVKCEHTVLSTGLAQWSSRNSSYLVFFWSVARAEEDFVVSHVLSGPVSCTESISGRRGVQRA